MPLYRQGDVNIATTGTLLADGSRVSELPPDAVVAKSPIIARGEFSGHCHAVRKPVAQPGGLMAHGGSLWVSSDGVVHIDHTYEWQVGADAPARAEHHTITFPSGTAGRVLIEREYEPEGLRYAQD